MNTNYGIIAGLKIEKQILKKSNISCSFGFGKENAVRESEKLAQKKLNCIINIGFAASTNKKIKTGDICLPKRIVWSDGNSILTSKVFRLKLIRKLKNNIVEDNLFCSNNIIYKKSEKKDIYKKYQAGLIDMESEGVQKVCIKYKIPFVALKIILDDSETSIPEDLVNFYFKDEKLKYLYKFPLYLFEIIKLGLSFLKARGVMKKVCRKLFENKR